MADFLCFHRVALLCRPIVAPTAEYAVTTSDYGRFVHGRTKAHFPLTETDFHNTRGAEATKEAHVTSSTWASPAFTTPTRHARLAASGRSKRRRLGPGAWIGPVSRPG